MNSFNIFLTEKERTTTSFIISLVVWIISVWIILSDHGHHRMIMLSSMTTMPWLCYILRWPCHDHAIFYDNHSIILSSSYHGEYKSPWSYHVIAWWLHLTMVWWWLSAGTRSKAPISENWKLCSKFFNVFSNKFSMWSGYIDQLLLATTLGLSSFFDELGFALNSIFIFWLSVHQIFLLGFNISGILQQLSGYEF